MQRSVKSFGLIALHLTGDLIDEPDQTVAQGNIVRPQVAVHHRAAMDIHGQQGMERPPARFVGIVADLSPLNTLAANRGHGGVDGDQPIGVLLGQPT